MTPSSTEQSNVASTPALTGRQLRAGWRRASPQVRAQVARLLALGQLAPDQPLASADQVEEELVVGLRALGAGLLGQWAQAAEAQVAAEVRARAPRAQVREKKRCAGRASSAR